MAAKLLIAVSFAALGFWSARYIQKPASEVVTVTQPEDCALLRLKPSGWSFRAEYNGGINKGGATSFTTYECK